jgi:hypothetical protein
MTLVRKLWAIGFVAVIAAFAGSPASAQPATWDQAKVTAIAKQLATASDAWWQALRDEGDDQDFVGSGDSQTYDSMTRESRTLNEAAQGLAGNLAGGKTRADTLDMYKSIKEVVDDMKVDQTLTFLEDSTIAAWKNFVTIFKQLAPYYDTAK